MSEAANLTPSTQRKRHEPEPGTAGKSLPDDIYVIIGNPAERHNPIKCEVDKDSGAILR